MLRRSMPGARPTISLRCFRPLVLVPRGCRPRIRTGLRYWPSLRAFVTGRAVVGLWQSLLLLWFFRRWSDRHWHDHRTKRHGPERFGSPPRTRRPRDHIRPSTGTPSRSSNPPVHSLFPQAVSPQAVSPQVVFRDCPNQLRPAAGRRLLLQGRGAVRQERVAIRTPVGLPREYWPRSRALPHQRSGQGSMACCCYRVWRGLLWGSSEADIPNSRRSQLPKPVWPLCFISSAPTRETNTHTPSPSLPSRIRTESHQDRLWRHCVAPGPLRFLASAWFTLRA